MSPHNPSTAKATSLSLNLAQRASLSDQNTLSNAFTLEVPCVSGVHLKLNEMKRQALVLCQSPTSNEDSFVIDLDLKTFQSVPSLIKTFIQAPDFDERGGGFLPGFYYSTTLDLTQILPDLKK